jgi:hypothetical protein
MADVPVRPPFDVGYKNGSGMPSSSQTFDLEATRKMILAFNINLDYIAQQQPEYKHVTLSASGVSDLSDYHMKRAARGPVEDRLSTISTAVDK